MTAHEIAIVDEVNSLARQRFAAEVKLREVKARHAAEIASLDQEIAVLDSQLWHTITSHRATLIDKGKQSFVTVVAQVAFRKIGASTKLVDQTTALKIARQIGIVRKVGKLSIKWSIDRSKLMAWLENHGEHREAFDECFEDIAEHESLTIKPNENYTVHHGKDRISPPPLTIQSPAPHTLAS